MIRKEDTTRNTGGQAPGDGTGTAKTRDQPRNTQRTGNQEIVSLQRQPRQCHGERTKEKRKRAQEERVGEVLTYEDRTEVNKGVEDTPHGRQLAMRALERRRSEHRRKKQPARPGEDIAKGRESEANYERSADGRTSPQEIGGVSVQHCAAEKRGHAMSAAKQN